jgi:hypothetical protein
VPALYDARRFWWAARSVTAIVFAAYAAYLIDEFFLSGRPFAPTPRSVASPWNSLLGFLAIGLPALWYTLFGKFSLRTSALSVGVTKPLDQWFFVTFDESVVRLRAQPPDGEPWEQSFPWGSITRVCFKDEGLWASDGIYVFTSVRPESFVVPTEASGGSEFLGAIVGRGLFPKDLLAKAVGSTDGGFYCWPPLKEDGRGS